MLGIIVLLIVIILVAIIAFLIHPILGLLWTVLPIVAIAYNWKDL